MALILYHMSVIMASVDLQASHRPLNHGAYSSVWMSFFLLFYSCVHICKKNPASLRTLELEIPLTISLSSDYLLCEDLHQPADTEF